jgi:glycosyltransferase involved in cell wall biosynthesis
MARFIAFLRAVAPDVVHGHGSKGGVYARFSGVAGGRRRAIRAYTPHGGSFNYQPGTALHRGYMLAEKLAAPLTDVFLFESAYIAGRFETFVGARNGARRVVANGLGRAEFAPAIANEDAADLLYVGELRAAKGIDTLLDAIALIGRTRGVAPRAVLVGSGPDEAMLTERANRLGIAASVTFPGPMPIRQAFALGRVLVVPSRTESMPYVVLEGAAARVPMIATRVGGIPEIYGPFADRLGPPDDPADLRARIERALATPPEQRAAEAAELAEHVAANFSIETMANAVMAGYAEAMARRPSAPLNAPSDAIPTHN